MEQTLKYTVVGVMDAAKIYMDVSNSYSGAYFIISSDQFTELRKSAYFSYVSESLFLGIDQDSQTFISETPLSYYQLKIDDTLPTGTIQMPTYYSDNYCDSNTYCEAVGDYTFTDFYKTYTVNDITIRFESNTNDWLYDDNFLRMSSDTLDLLVYDEIYQVSVISNTDLDVSRLVKAISNIDNTILTTKYKVFYPFDSNTSDNFTALLLLLSTVGIVALVTVMIIGSTLITYVIFKAIINTKLHDYAIFRTIGANQKMIRYFIYLENIFVVLISYFIFLGVSIFLKTQADVGGFFYSLKSFTFTDYLVFFVILTFMSLFISRKYCARIFNESVNRVLKAE
jgi:hypothetical protein